jgi:hypothetical protein
VPGPDRAPADHADQPILAVLMVETARPRRRGARCTWGKRDATKSIRECVSRYDLDLDTLIWSRGAAFPISMLAERLKCPRCGSRRVALMFNLPGAPVARRAGSGGRSNVRRNMATLVSTARPIIFVTNPDGASFWMKAENADVDFVWVVATSLCLREFEPNLVDGDDRAVGVALAYRVEIESAASNKFERDGTNDPDGQHEGKPRLLVYSHDLPPLEE